MSIRRPFCLGFLLCAVLSLPASGQTDSIGWNTNIETAKAEARRTGRYVLVHFWTEDCAPCMALERNVFSQPEVAAALNSQFVPVKLNANDSPATAAGMGVTRVPTDIVITPDGEVVAKMISPATPMAYIGDLSQVVAKHIGRSGQPYAGAIASAPQPSQLNAAYAGLQVNPTTPPALAEANRALAENRFAAARPTGSTGPVFASPQPGPALPTSQPGAWLNPQMGQLATGTPTGATTPAIVPQADRVSLSAQPATAGQPPAMPVVSSSAVVNNQFAQPTTGLQPAAPLFDANANRYAAQNTAPAASAASASPARQTIANQFAIAPQVTSTAPQAPTPTATASALPDSRQLPPGAMPLGFDGYCPVSMRNSNLTKWVPGNPQFGVQHRGRTYWFAGPQEKQQFWANPDAFAPALSGLDPVMFVDRHQQVPGSREHSIDYNNMFYMFASEASLQQFSANPEKYAVGVREAMGIKATRTLR